VLGLRYRLEYTPYPRKTTNPIGTKNRNEIQRYPVQLGIGWLSHPITGGTMNFRGAQKDLGAACVGALATLPQAVAYGLIAVSPLGSEWAVFGITASVGSAILFGILTGALGSNPFLISGPRAVTALVLAVGIQAGLERGYDPELALSLAFAGIVVAGLFQTAAGYLKLGRAVSYVPVPVLAGFVSASALLVLLSSVPMVLGVPEMPMQEILFGGARSINFWALAVGGLTIFFTFLLEGRFRWIPAALGGLMTGTALYYLGILVFGQPAGPQIGHIDLLELLRLPMLLDADLGWAVIQPNIDIPLLTGLSIGLLTSFDTVFSSSALDMHTSTDSNTNHDLQLHGFANVVMGLFGFLPGSGTLSRSTAVIKAGAQSRAANTGTGVVFCFLLAGLAPLVEAVPLWATAGMLVATAVQAIDKPTLKKATELLTRQVPYGRVLAGDISITLVVVITALAFDLIASVGVGILLAITLFVFGIGHDPLRRIYLGTRIHSKVQRPLRQMECLQSDGHRIAVIEMQGALFFGTCAQVRSEVQNLLAHGVSYLILDFRYLTSIDSSGSAALRSLQIKCAEAGGRLMLSCIERERRTNRSTDTRRVQQQRRQKKLTPRWVWLNLQVNGVISSIGEDWIFDDTNSALACCEDLLLNRLGKSGRRGRRGVIASSSIFTGLSREQIIGLGRFARRHRFSAGDVVFVQGDSDDRVFLLIIGRVDALIKIPGSSRKRRVSVFTEGTLFGEMGFIDGAPRSATITAARNSVCLSIDAPSLKILEKEKPAIVLTLMRNLSRQFAERLRLANNMISELEQ
jgi:MFS superfamily sulfate permease-like transporter